MAVARTARTNPHWARDELILALDLYFDHRPDKISVRHPAVRELSDVLNRLPIHGDVSGFPKFRNANGVYMKMCNFLRFDPSYTGKGLTGGAHAEEAVWTEFAADHVRLRHTADAIKTGLHLPEAAPLAGTEVDEEEQEFPEGKVLYRLHRARERNARLRERAKAAALKEGRGLGCQVCGFDFQARYGALGSGFIECHHTRPVSELGTRATTRIKDVALLCSNCHRMVHRKRPWLNLEHLRGVLAESAFTTSTFRS